MGWEVDPDQIQWGERIAVGGFAEVFQARWQGTTVAVKRLLENDDRVVQRLITEVQVGVNSRIAHVGCLSL
jgi:hypothetical protein